MERNNVDRAPFVTLGANRIRRIIHWRALKRKCLSKLLRESINPRRLKYRSNYINS